MPKSPTALLQPGWIRSRRNLALLLCATLALAIAVLSLMAMMGGPATPLSARNASDASGASASPLALTGVTGTTPATATAEAATTETVYIKNYAYSPATLTISAGTKVTWINQDTASHTVTTTSGPKSFDSGEIKNGGSYSYTFETAGTYSYYCSYHPDMKATVTVTAAVEPSPSPTVTTTTTASPSPTASASPTATSSTGTCTGAATDIFTTILQHIYTAHLERSPAQQVSDALALDQYIKTHTAWVQMILQSGTDEAKQALTGLTPLLNHLYMAHLQRSPADQVADATAVNQYLLTHTVLIEDILKPGLGGLLGGSC